MERLNQKLRCVFFLIFKLKLTDEKKLKKKDPKIQLFVIKYFQTFTYPILNVDFYLFLANNLTRGLSFLAIL